MSGLRIAITVDPELPVPPENYGGIERIAYSLVSELAKQGHEVTLFAHRDSLVPCHLAAYPGLSSASFIDTCRNTARIANAVCSTAFDVIHSFGRLAYLVPLLPLAIPKIMSYQRHVNRRSVLWGNRLSRGALQFTACSRCMTRDFENLAPWHVIYNAACPNQYRFQPKVDSQGPLVFLGRVERIKGPHLAIAVALRSGRDLIIAGNVPADVQHRLYFDTEIKPHLDGNRVRYLGPVNDVQKNALLGKAAVLLMPVVWEEPFGIVMAEALACGTPVIGLRRGAIPEVIQHGITGFICDDVQEMVSAVGRLVEIDRALCRRSMEERFSTPVMVQAYLSLYLKVLKQRHHAS